MARKSAVSIAIYRRHTKLYRYLNDLWIFTELMRPHLVERAIALFATGERKKRSYPVPKRDTTIMSRRRDEDIGHLFAYYNARGIFENNIVSIISRAEAFLQDALSIVLCAYPHKLVLIADKGGIPLDLFLESEAREDVIRRFVAMRCEGLMFGKPSDYLEKAARALSIDLDVELVKDFIEIKASRDLIIHNNGVINKLYREKSGDRARGELGDALIIDEPYLRHVLITVKKFSGSIQHKTEEVYG